MSRSTGDVFEDHLRLRRQGELEADLARNFAADVLLLCEFGVLRGHDGVRESASRLRGLYPGADYEYLVRLVDGEFAYLKWRAKAPDGRTGEGADTFVVRGGKIVMQSIYYREEHSG